MKYKQIARNFKVNLEQIVKTLVSLKKLSGDEIKSLQANVKLLERMIQQKTFS